METRTRQEDAIASRQSYTPLEIGLPSGKGIGAPTRELFARAGLPIPDTDRRLSFEDADLDWGDIRANVTLLKTGEIPALIQAGVLDIGISTSDYIRECMEYCYYNDIPGEIRTSGSYNYSRSLSRSSNQDSCSRTVFCIDAEDNQNVFRWSDLKGTVIDSERPWLTKNFVDNIFGIGTGVVLSEEELSFSAGTLDKTKTYILPKKGSVEGMTALRRRRFLSGPTKPNSLVTISETGKSLEANKLQVLATLMENTVDLVRNANKAFPDRTERIRSVANIIAERLRLVLMPSSSLANVK